MHTLSAQSPSVPQVVRQHPAPSITLSVAREEEPLRDFRKLVFEQYAKRNWLDTNMYPDGIVTDEYDESSDALIIRANTEIVAGMRIVKDKGLGFPHEHELRLDKLVPDSACERRALETLLRTPRNRMAEITKVVGKKRQRMLTFDIIKCLYWYARMNAIDVYVMVIDMEFFVLCDNLGIPISPIGIPVFCEGSWTIPAITEPSRYGTEIPKKSPTGWEYVSLPDNLDGTWSIQ